MIKQDKSVYITKAWKSYD